MNYLNFGTALFYIWAFSGVAFLIAGYILMNYPPQTRNWWYGYRSKRSMQSQSAWDFAQVYAGKKMLVSGLVMLLLATLALFLPNIQVWVEVVSGVAVLVFAAIVPIYQTEKALKKRFG